MKNAQLSLKHRLDFTEENRKSSTEAHSTLPGFWIFNNCLNEAAEKVVFQKAKINIRLRFQDPQAICLQCQYTHENNIVKDLITSLDVIYHWVNSGPYD